MQKQSSVSSLSCHSRVLVNKLTDSLVRCLISYCSGKRQGLFGLPINLWALSAIRFAIAHKVHGRALISGIPRGSTSLDDWDASRDNMSIETCTDNWIKWQFPEEEYPEIIEGFKHLQMPKSIYDPSIECEDVGDHTLQEIESFHESFHALTESQLLDIHGGGVNVVNSNDDGTTLSRSNNTDSVVLRCLLA